MKTEEITKTLEVEGTEIKYEIIREGQEQVNNGDRVVVRGRIYLPAIKGKLINKIRFEIRLMVLGQNLYSSWGLTKKFNGEWRYISHRMKGNNYKILFMEEEEYLLKEIKKIEETLVQRREALEKAEE